MPRQYLRISDFSGGLNTRFDPRDVGQNEIIESNFVQVYKTGQIFTASAKVDVTSRGAGTSTDGKGFFLFKSDNDISNTAKSIELAALADVASGYVDILEDPFNTISARDVANHLDAFDLGTNHAGGEFVYYYVDGALRVCDAETGQTGNTAYWYGHVDKSGTIPGGAVDSWISATNNLAAPTATNLTNTGSAEYATAGHGFDVDVTVETTDDDGLWEATTYEFAQSFVYEGNQESLLTAYSENVVLSTNNYFTNVLVGIINNPSGGSDFPHRIKGGRVYIRKKDSTDLWTLFLDIDFERGVRKDMGDTFTAWHNPSSNNWKNNGGIEIKGPSIDTYESNNGYSPDVGHLSFGEAAGLFYKDATVCSQRAFVAHVNYYTPIGGAETKLMPDRILYTPIGRYDTFPPNQFIDIGINDGEDFTALESFGTKLLAFKESTLYIIDVTSPNDSEWFLESTHNGLGIDKPSAVVKTEFGVCWARKTGIYAWSPTQGIVELSAKMDKNLAPISEISNPVVGYYPPDSQLLVIKNCGAGSDLLVYDFTTKSFTEFSSYTGDAITNMQNNADNCVWVEDGTALRKYSPVQSTASASWDFTTKDFDFGNPGITKKILKIIVSYSTASGVSAASVTVDYFKDGETTRDGYVTSTWSAATRGGIINISGGDFNNPIGFCSSLKLKFSGSGSYKINDVTIIYRTRMKPPATAQNS